MIKWALQPFRTGIKCTRLSFVEFWVVVLFNQAMASLALILERASLLITLNKLVILPVKTSLGLVTKLY
jgi:hypothetical protein